MKMSSISPKLNYKNALKCAGVSEIAVPSVQNWFVETVVRFTVIRFSTPRKNTVRMSGIVTDAIKGTITVPRPFSLRTIW